MSLSIFSHRECFATDRISFRSSRPGPERELVEEFLQNFPFETPSGCIASVFCEPRIESGYPDLVIVFWKVAPTEKWSRKRLDLRREDYRVLQFLHESESASVGEMTELFQRPIEATLQRLHAAELIQMDRRRWRPNRLSSIFAVRHIIAIEAKISDWRGAVEQAFLNTWFATESFVLLPRSVRPGAACEAAQSRGVRICSPGERLSLMARPAVRKAFPKSYLSWMFNDWAWQSSIRETTRNEATNRC